MKQIINYEESLGIFKKYIRDNISEESINKLISAFAKVQGLGLGIFKINTKEDIYNIFTMEFTKIRNIKNILKKNSQYFVALNLADEYIKFKKGKKKKKDKTKFDFQNFERDAIINFSTIIEQFKTYYNNFISSENKDIVYSIIDKFEVRACPYCNLSYIDVIRNENENILRPALDHFYPKSKYPFFALSFFNLVPTCYECNSPLKRVEDTKEIINPFEKDFDKLAKFTISLSGDGQLNHILSDLSAFDIELNSIKNNDKDIIDNQKECFALNIRYRYRKDEASEIFSKCILDTPEFRSEIRRVFPNISTKYIEKLIYGNSLSCDDINKRPLAKMTCDLVEFYKTKTKGK